MLQMAKACVGYIIEIQRKKELKVELLYYAIYQMEKYIINITRFDAIFIIYIGSNIVVQHLSNTSDLLDIKNIINKLCFIGLYQKIYSYIFKVISQFV